MKKDKWFIKGYKEALKDVKDLIEFLEISLIRKKEKNGLENIGRLRNEIGGF